MKLIDLLVQELPKRGGWPKDAKCCAQSVVDNEIYFYDRAYDGQGAMSKYLGEIYLTTADETGIDKYGLLTGCVNKEQYEAALAASKQPEWSGQGLPPVGAECEIESVDEWCRIRINAYSDGATFITWLSGPHSGVDLIRAGFSNRKLRPISTEAERKREEAAKSMLEVIESQKHRYTENAYMLIYDAIAAGKIPGIKLAD